MMPAPLILTEDNYHYTIYPDGSYTVEHLTSFYKSAGTMRIVGSTLLVSDATALTNAPVNGDLADKVKAYLSKPEPTWSL